jgi:hypothetical protein
MGKIRFANYGQLRDINATSEELKMFETICGCISAEYDHDRLQLVRKSDDYVTVVYGDWDIARLKFTKRAKWILIPNEAKAPKRRMQEPSDVAMFASELSAAVAHAVKYQ